MQKEQKQEVDMAKGPVSKKHIVRANLGVRELTKAGTSLELQILAEGQRIGRLIIGRGSLFWYGRRRQLKKRIPWTRFAEMMDDLAYGSKG